MFVLPPGTATPPLLTSDVRHHPGPDEGWSTTGGSPAATATRAALDFPPKKLGWSSLVPSFPFRGYFARLPRSDPLRSRIPSPSGSGSFPRPPASRSLVSSSRLAQLSRTCPRPGAPVSLSLLPVPGSQLFCGASAKRPGRRAAPFELAPSCRAPC